MPTTSDPAAAQALRHRCQAYGLRIDSELELPELAPADPAADDGPADVRIVFGAVERDGPADGSARAIGPILWARPGALWLQVPGVAGFRVEDGERITVDPDPAADDDSLRLFLLGSALGALLWQRGATVLHGNAVQVGEGVLVCVGASGAGKSTLAAGFARRGHALLADDVVALDDAGRVQPGLARVRLWQDMVAQLGIDSAQLRRVRPGLAKYTLPVLQPVPQPLPLRWLYLLEAGERAEPVVTPVEGLKRFALLRAHAYRPRFVEGMGLAAQQLQACGRIAASVHVARLERPRRGGDLDALIDRLLEDTARHG